MSKITKENMVELRKDIDAALLAVAQKHGLQSLQATKGKYDHENGGFSFNLVGVVSGGLDENASRYKAWAPLYKWPEIFTEFDMNKGHYKIVGCNTTRSKIFCSREGKVYEFPIKLFESILATIAAKEKRG